MTLNNKLKRRWNDVFPKPKVLITIILMFIAYSAIYAQAGLCLQQYFGLPVNRTDQNPFTGLVQTKISVFGPYQKKLNGVLAYSFTHFFDTNDYIVKRRNHAFYLGFRIHKFGSGKLSMDLLGSYNFLGFELNKKNEMNLAIDQPKSAWTQYGLEAVFNYRINSRVSVQSGFHSILQRVLQRQNSLVWLSLGMGIQLIKSND